MAKSNVKLVLSGLVYSQLVFALLLGGLPTLIIYASKTTPRKQSFYLFDASLSGEPHDNSVPGVVAVLGSLALALVQIVVSEFVLMRDARPSLVARWTHTLQAIINLFAGFAYHICVQQLTAVFVGKQRPNFIESCQPSAAAYANALPFVNPEGVHGYIVNQDECTGSDYNDSMKSFPSGHSSSTAMLTFFGFFYLLYTWYYRRPKCYADEWQRHSGMTRFFQDIRLGLAGVFIFAQFVWIWFVGLSRYIDNKHHIEDIIGGWLLGTLFALLFVVDAFGREYRMNMPTGQNPEHTLYSDATRPGQVQMMPPPPRRTTSNSSSDPLRLPR